MPVSTARVWSEGSRERAHLLSEATTEERTRPLCQCSHSQGALYCVLTNAVVIAILFAVPRADTAQSAFLPFDVGLFICGYIYNIAQWIFGGCGGRVMFHD